MGMKALGVALVILATASAFAQSPIGTGHSLTPPPTNLAVEVYFFPKEPPAYMTVAPEKAPAIGQTFGRFGHVPGWIPSAEFPTIRVVDVRPLLSGGVVRVTVAVLFGKTYEYEKRVGVYTIREGERVRVQELSTFGVEPFELALVRVEPVPSNLPQFASKAKSVELVTIQPNLSTLASNRLVLRNISTKNIRALTVRSLQGDRLLLSGGREGKEGGPLIPAGGVGEITWRATTRAAATPGGYKPVTLPNQTIEIAMAMFEDGSYEGDPDSAFIFKGALKGSRIQIGKIVELLQETLQSGQSDPATVLKSLLDQLEAPNNEADQADVQELIKEFPASAKKPEEIRELIKVEMRLTRKDLLDEIRHFQSQNPALGANTVRTWLTMTKQRYEAWLGRL
jgi:hypothetical protein